ncbi:hypothetical protein GEMRC1_007463 [Eukaryota sp. GEM-RC1]
MGIHSDNGPEFNNSVMKFLCSKLNIDHSFSIPYFHESNGIVERKNQDVMTLLRKLLIDFNLYQSWSFLIPLVQLTLNSTKCSITNATPNEIIFGSDTSPRRNLLDALQSLTEPVNVQRPLEKEDDTITYIRNMTAVIMDKAKQARADQEHYLDKLLSNQPDEQRFQIGDLVLRFSPKRLGKLHGHEGPFRIVSLVGSNSYMITSLTSNATYLANKHQLIPYYHSGNEVRSLIEVAATDLNEFVIDEIKEHMMLSEGYWFLIRWLGNVETWEPHENLKNDAKLIKYMKDHKLKQPQRKKRK